MRCLAPKEIDRYISGAMEAKVADEVGKHLATCRRCKQAVAEAKGKQARSEEEDQGREEGGRAMIKVQCSRCKGKYGIPEERVRGRVLKIRCKNCGSLIEVRGETKADSPSRSVLERGKRVWFLVVKRERVGPFTEQEVREQLGRGEIKPKAYAWRQGFSKWERLLSIPEFSDLVGEQPPPTGIEVPRSVEPPTRKATLPLGSREDSDSAPTFVPEAVRASSGAGPGPAAARAEAAEDDLAFDTPEYMEGASPSMHTSAAEEEEEDSAIETRRTRVAQPGAVAGLEKLSQPVPEAEAPRPKERKGADRPWGREQSEDKPTGIHHRDGRPFGADPPLSLSTLSAKARESEAKSAASVEDASPRVIVSPRDEESEAEPRMKGQRHDNSVLFSLSHLKSVAVRTPSESREPSHTSTSGLFDIRPLAGPPVSILLPSPPEEKRSSYGAILLVGFAGVVLGAGALFGILYAAQPRLVRAIFGGEAPGEPGRAAVPAPAPSAPETKPLARPAAVAVAEHAEQKAEAAAAKGGGKPETVASAAPGAEEGGGKAAAEAEAPSPRPAAEEGGGARSRKAAKSGRAAAPAAPAGRPHHAARPVHVAAAPSRGSGLGAKDEPSDLPADLPPPPPPRAAEAKSKAPEKKKALDDIDSLIDAASGRDTKPRAKKTPSVVEEHPRKAAAGGGGEGSEGVKLSRDQVASGMKRANGAVQGCKAKFSYVGIITVEATIDGGSGSISRGKIVGSVSGTPIGDCVLNAAISTARFPNFSGTPITVRFPYVLQ